MSDVEERLQRLEDLLAIQQLFVDYGRHLDAGDFAAYANLFAEDGQVLLGPMGRAEGRQEIEALMTRAMDVLQGTSFHLVTSPMVQLDGDRATATVMWTVIGRNRDGGPTVTMLGRHADVLARQADGWRFAERRGFVDLPARLPG